MKQRNLPPRLLAVRRRTVRGILIRFAILFSVILAGLHVPAVAADLGEVDGIVTAYCAEHDDGPSVDHKSIPGEQGNEGLHHHHCPMAADLDGPADSSDLAPMAQVHVPAALGALKSRATAPPIDPPLA